jgi:diaminohydroxyphosphoribosylaminopyrimidine deaminase/5-amino-6-(5-phosphoribosylamino)uracil reductase
MTLDGKIATKSGESMWITNEKSRYFVHELRNRVSGIMVGINTILKDNPSLTTRLNEGGTDATRIIVDSTLRIPLNSKVLNLNSLKRTIIATTEKADKDKLKQLSEIEGVEVLIVPQKNTQVDLVYLFDYLGKSGIDSLLVEGGSQLNFSILKEGLADKVVTFIAPKILGGVESKTPVGGKGFEHLNDAVVLEDINIKTFDEDIMVEAYVRK